MLNLKYIYNSRALNIKNGQRILEFCTSTKPKVSTDLLKNNIVLNDATLSRHMSSSSIRKPVEFYYDVASPYSWLAFEVIHRYVNQWNIDLKLKPILMGGLFAASENQSPMMGCANKQHYLLNDLKASTKVCDVDLKLMKNPADLFIKGSMKPMRCLTALKSTSPQHLESVSREFWRIRWNLDQDFTSDDNLKLALSTHIDDSSIVEKVLERMTAQDIKDELKHETQAVVDKGAFGVPTFILPEQNELFFGADRFPHMAMTLNEEWKGFSPK